MPKQRISAWKGKDNKDRVIKSPFSISIQFYWPNWRHICRWCANDCFELDCWIFFKSCLRSEVFVRWFSSSFVPVIACFEVGVWTGKFWATCCNVKYLIDLSLNLSFASVFIVGVCWFQLKFARLKYHKWLTCSWAKWHTDHSCWNRDSWIKQWRK